MTSAHNKYQIKIPAGQEGKGLYGKLALTEKELIREIIPLILPVIECITPCEKKPFVICDYGAADGRVSMPLITRCIDAVRQKHGCQQEVMVVYDDQPSNDFQSLFYNLHGEPSSGNHTSYLKSQSGVYVMACATTFYSQCLPSQSLHLGISTMAMMILSKSPCELENSIAVCLPETSSSERQMFAKQAAEDWETILLARAAELVPGGQLCFLVLSTSEDGAHGVYSRNIKFPLFTSLNDLWRDYMKKGIITKAEFCKAQMSGYFRTEAEMAAPFIDENSPVYKAGLRLRNIKTIIQPCAYHTAWKEYTNKDSHQALEHARKYVASVRRWSDQVFHYGLADGRTEAVKNEIIDRFHEDYVQLVAAAPDDHGYDYVSVFIHIHKMLD